MNQIPGKVEETISTVTNGFTAITNTVLEEFGKLLDEIPRTIDQEFIKPLEEVCDDGVNIIRNFILVTIGLGDVPFEKIRDLIVDKIDEAKTLVENIDSTICGSTDTSLRSEIENVKRAVNEDLCSAEDSIEDFASRKNICSKFETSRTNKYSLVHLCFLPCAHSWYSFLASQPWHQKLFTKSRFFT